MSNKTNHGAKLKGPFNIKETSLIVFLLVDIIENQFTNYFYN